MNQLTFDGQTAIVTGAGTGIGFEIAQQLSDLGASVLLNDINDSLANQAAEKIKSVGGKCISLAGDAGNTSFIQKLVDLAISEFGQLNIAIANAGITTYGSFLDYSPESFQKLIHLNLQGSFFLAQTAARQMKAQKSGGRILLMSSVTGVQAHPFLVPYGMTKAALQMLAKGLVCELSQFGITVNAIAPGAVVTERTLSEDPDYPKEWSKLTPTRNVTYPKDVAQTALFLVSPHSGQVNGQTIIVDGGWSATSPTPNLDSPEG